MIHAGLPEGHGPPPQTKPTPRIDRYGDPLPEGALARLGTVRLRHPGYVGSMLFSPDGKTLAAAGSGSVSLWDWSGGKELPRLPAAHVGAVTFSPDGKTLASASDREKVRLWDVEKRKEIAALEVRREASMVYRPALAFAEGGKLLVYAGDDRVAQRWDVKSGKERLFFKVPQNSDILSAVAIGAGGKVLACATRWADGTNAGPVCLYDVATGKELHRLRDHKQPVWSLAFSPDGRTLASASTTEAPILWEVATGKPLRTLRGEEHSPQSLAFSRDGRTLAVGDSWYKLRLWDVATGKRIEAFASDLAGSSCLAFSPDGKTLAVGDGNAIRVLDAASGKETRPLAEPTYAVHSVSWMPDGKTVALGTRDALWLRESATGRPLGKLWQTPKARFDSSAFSAVSPDGKYFGLARATSVHLFDATSRKPLHRLLGSNFTINSFAFSADGKAVAAAVGYDVVSVWDAATGKPRFDLKGKRGTQGVALSPDGRTIATAYESDTGETSGVQLWDQASGKALRDLPVNKAWVRTLAFSADSKALAALTDSQWDGEGGLILWELPAGKRRFRLPEVDAVAVAFSPDGKLVACEGRGNAVSLLDTATGKERHLFRGHRARISALAFSPDGSLLLSASWDATALVWGHVGVETHLRLSRIWTTATLWRAAGDAILNPTVDREA